MGFFLFVGRIWILKVHKIENFFGFDFEICTVSLLVMSKYKSLPTNFFVCAIIGGVTIFLRSPRTTQNEKNFEGGQKFFFVLFFSLMNPLYLFFGNLIYLLRKGWL